MLNSADTLTVVGIVVGVFGACLTAVWTLSWWLSSQFTGIKELLYTEMRTLEKILLSKLEYHEKHDDARFTNIGNDLWDIRVRNAAKDGYPALESRNKPVDY